MKHGWNTDFSKPVRADIFVASPATDGQSSVGATSSEYAAPTGLEIILVWGSTNMPRLTALGMVCETVLGATPETATGTGALPGKVPAVRPMAVWGGRTGQRAFGIVERRRAQCFSIKKRNSLFGIEASAIHSFVQLMPAMTFLR